MGVQPFELCELRNIGKLLQEGFFVILEDAGAPEELFHGESAEIFCCSCSGEDMAGTGDKITDWFRGPLSDEDCTCGIYLRCDIFSLGAHYFEVFGGVLVCDIRRVGDVFDKYEEHAVCQNFATAEELS